MTTEQRKYRKTLVDAALDLKEALTELIYTIEDNRQFPDRSPKLIDEAIEKGYESIDKAEGLKCLR